MIERTPTSQPSPTLHDAQPLTPRYGQLVYTSFDDGSGVGGGWQVKAEAGGLSPTERETLTARIVTTFDLDPALKEFPTTDEIARRPARLAYATLSGTSAAYWHTVDAGRDATGRPGNVLAHVVLDRRTADPSVIRPIQLWNSPDWLRPYGAQDVLATALNSEAIPVPNPGITAQSAVSFLTDTTIDRQSVFRVLLDALHAAMARGPKVALVTSDHDSGPKWIAALSFFMSPGAARRFNWSSHDKPELALTDARRGVHLVVVPRSTASALHRGDWVVIDETEEPYLGELGSVHTTATGKVTVTPWSTMAEGVLGGEHLALRVLTRQDAIAQEVGDHDLSPLWPLAVAVRSEPELAEFHPDADQMVADDAPARAQSVAWLNSLVAEAGAATAPANASEALDRLIDAKGRSAGLERAARQLLQAALTDPVWLDCASLAQVPSAPATNLDDVVPAIDERFDTLRSGLPDASGQTVRAALRTTELLIKLALPGERQQRVLQQIANLVREAGLEFLWQGAGASSLADGGDIGVHTREAILRPVLAEQPAAGLSAIDLTTWRWVFGEEAATPGQIGALPPNPYPFDEPLYPRYVLALLANPTAVDTARMAQLVGDAVDSALGAPQITDDECQSLVTELDGYAPLPSSSLIDMFTHWPHRISPAVTIDDILCRTCPPEFVSMIAAYPLDVESNTSTPARCAVAAARLRSLYTAPRPLHPDELNAALQDVLPVLIKHVSTPRVDDMTTEFVAVLGALVIAAQSRGLPSADVDDELLAALRSRLAPDNDVVVALVAEMAVVGVVDQAWLVGQALIARFNADWSVPTVLGGRAEGNRRDGWAGNVVSRLIEGGAYHGPEDPASLRNCTWPQVRTLNASAAEEFFTRYLKVAREWLHDYRIGESDGSRLGLRRRN